VDDVGISEGVSNEASQEKWLVYAVSISSFELVTRLPIRLASAKDERRSLFSEGSWRVSKQSMSCSDG